MWQSRQLLRVDEGGGGGGQRREENVLKSMRELGEIVNFVMIVCPFSSGDISREVSVTLKT